ncbi:SHOCT domain-containing protein [Jonesiaceae bacterium BS-20]|uniref:SHOCT domain-containing protein n=1 Tax=Jonesiaceae bacterium BS-20 TaxID=3120821 RepID=A0AAU7DVF1_9MICO
MNTANPTFAGWYEDPETKSNHYWDGSRWTGDTRPARRQFAAPAKEQTKGTWFLAIGAIFLIGPFTDAELELGGKVFFFAAGIVLVAIGIYMFRGQGPTTKAVQQRVHFENLQEQERQQAMQQALQNSAAQSQVNQQFTAPAQQGSDSAHSAQVNAIASLETAKALQNLQALLFTRTITEEEFQAAKNKLFASNTSDTQVEIQKLADLYSAGLIGDYEFIAAKARILGI